MSPTPPNSIGLVLDGLLYLPRLRRFRPHKGRKRRRKAGDL